MSKFSVGEVAVVAKTAPNKEKYIGMECEILTINDGNESNYSILINGVEKTCWEWCLRKLKPPREELGEWESLESNIGWKRPVEVVA